LQITSEVIPFHCHTFLPVNILLLEAPLLTSSCHLLKGHIINLFLSISVWNQYPFKSTSVFLNGTQSQMLNLKSRVVMEAVVSFFVEYSVSKETVTGYTGELEQPLKNISVHGFFMLHFSGMNVW
jgi:hypothetical protein